MLSKALLGFSVPDNQPIMTAHYDAQLGWPGSGKTTIRQDQIWAFAATCTAAAGMAYNVPALCIVMLIAVAEFSTLVNKTLIVMRCFGSCMPSGMAHAGRHVQSVNITTSTRSFTKS